MTTNSKIRRPLNFVRIVLACFVLLILYPLLNRAGSQTPSVTGEESVKKFRGNVVRVDTTFRGSEQPKTGFGFIVGARGGQLVVVTANHVVRSNKPDAGVSKVTVTFFGGAVRQATLLPKRHDRPDLAVLEVPSPSNFRWVAESIAPSTEIVRNREVWFIGRRGDWEIPTKESTRISGVLDQESMIEVSTTAVTPGTSGAPLLTENGIIGMIISDGLGAVVKALSIDFIRRSLEEWSYAWSAQEVRTLYWGVPPSSRVLSTIDVTPDQREIYVALDKKAQVAIFDADSQQQISAINIGNQMFKNGSPQILALAPRRGQNGEFYVVDANANELVVFDRKKRGDVVARIPIGQNPRFIAITPDQRKAYVSNEQPAPQGSISVINLVDHKVTATITGVNCPEGLVISPDGVYLYVVTQCGAGQDPLFIIDTATDTVVKRVPGFAVGLDVTISSDGKKLYVARGSFQTRDISSGQLITVPSKLSVIKTSDNSEMKSLTIPARVLAFTADGKHLVVGGERIIYLIDTGTDEIANQIPLSTSPAGIATTRDDKAYVWLPDENRLFLLGLSGLRGP